MYARIDSYYFNKMSVKTSSMIFAAATVGTLFMAITNAVDKRSVVYHQMHAGQHIGTGLPPKSYWTMDWMMTPRLDPTDDSGGSVVQPGMCEDGDKDCNPSRWQSTAICDMSKTERAGIKQSIKDDEPYLHSGMRKKWRHIRPQDTCYAEKIGGYVLWQNNEQSWSLGSTHNVFVLVAGVFAVLALISISSFLHAARDSGNGETEQNQMFLTVLVFGYLAISYFWASSTGSDEGIHRPIGLASFFYSGIALIASLLVFNGQGVIEDDKERVAESGGNSTEMQPIMQKDENYDVKEHFMNQTHSEMTVHGFLPSSKISLPGTAKVGARLKGADLVSKQSVGVEGCGCLSKPQHSKFVYAQLFVMPLVFVILVIHKNNYGLDTTTQIVALLALTVSLLDCFLYRLWWAFNVHKSMGVAVSSEPGESIHEEYMELMLISVLVVLVQVTVYVYYLLSELFHDDVWWILILVIVFSTIVKLVAVMSIYNNRDEGESPKYDTFNNSVRLLGNADYMLFLLFNILLWLVVYVELVGMKAEHPKMLAPDAKLTTLWGSGWREFDMLT